MLKSNSKLSDNVIPCKPKPVFLAEFENGSLKASGKSKLKFTSYIDGSENPKRILVANSSRLTYVGSNFESDIPKITSTRLKICVLNRKYNTIKLFDADFFKLKPQLKRSQIIDTKDDTTEKSYTEKSSDLTLAFGSKTQMKKINSKARYAGTASSGSMEVTMKSISDAVIEQVIPKENNVTSVIPPQNSSAVNVDEIYNIYDIISKEEFDVLDSEAQVFLDAKYETVQLWKKENKYPDIIIQYLEKGISKDIHKAKLLCYLHFMLCFLRTTFSDWRRKDPVPAVPQPFKQKLIDSFSLKTSMPARLKDKLLAYSMVLILKLNNYVIDSNVLASSTKISIKRITDVAYALGCYVSGNKSSNSKIIQLKLPLYKFEGFSKKKF